MREAQSDPSVAERFWRDEKLPAIETLAAGRVAYIETSHLFNKGFVEPLLELGYVPDVIVLNRDARKVALSMLQRGSVPGRTERALRFYLSPTDPVRVPLPNYERFTDYQLCYWYTLEVQAREEHYVRSLTAKGARVTYTSIDEAKTVSGFQRLLTGLGLPRPTVVGWMRFLWRARKRVNVKAHKKVTHELGRAEAVPRLDALEDEVRRAVSMEAST